MPSGLVEMSLACGNYDINHALLDGSVRPAGLALTVMTEPSPQRHWRMGRHLEYDACELSLGTYVTMRGRGRHDVVAIPVFPHRRFRHSFAYVNTGASIRTPKSLEGRRVGLRTWQTTAGVWLRGILQDDYGVDFRRIQWFIQDEEEEPFPRPAGISLERVGTGKSVVQMLLDGELDALMYPETPQAIESRDPRVGRLFHDPKREEIAYFKRTGIFPIMHTVVIKSHLVDRYPWLARNLLEAFRESKERAFREMRNPRRISLAWVSELIEEQREILGPDPWSYEFAPNRHALEVFVRYAQEQGLTEKAVPIEGLFVGTTFDELPRYVA